MCVCVCACKFWLKVVFICCATDKNGFFEAAYMEVVLRISDIHNSTSTVKSCVLLPDVTEKYFNILDQHINTAGIMNDASIM